MATRYEIHTKQKFTDWGIIGVYLFVLSPIASGIGVAWLSDTLNGYSPSPLGPALLLLVSGLAFLVGSVLILIGRSQIHNVYRSVVAETNLESAARDIGYR